MSKKLAREILENYLIENGGVFPITDAVVWQVKSKKCIHSFTFKGLLCLAYDLMPTEIEV
jgi:hypothetical protein